MPERAFSSGPARKTGANGMTTNRNILPAIETENRAPTEAEIAETNALQDAAKAKVDSLQSAAAKAAVASFNNSEKHSFNATVSLALNLCAEQMLQLTTEQAYEAQKDDYVWRRDVLFPVADAGGMIYRATEDDVAKLATLKSKARKEAVASYVRTKGAKLVQSLAILRTNGFRLAAYARENMGGTIIEAARIAQDAGVPAAVEFWRNAVVARFGESMAKLSSGLATWADAEKQAAKADKADAKADDKADAKADAAKADADDKADADANANNAPRDKVADAMAIVATMNEGELAAFLFRLKAETVARQTKADADAKADAKPDADASSPVALAA
jgi:hypothetical protein